MKINLLPIFILLCFTLNTGKAQLSGTTPVLWPSFFPVIGDLRSVNTIGETADANLYQDGEEIPADESGFSFSPQPESQPAIRVFPNPTSDYFQLAEAADVDKIVLYSMTGRQVRTFDPRQNNRHYVGDLPDGMYLASLVSAQEGVFKTLRLLKRSLRP